MEKRFGFVLLMVIVTSLFCQTNVGHNYTYGGRVCDIAQEGDLIWLATSGGLVKLNSISGEKQFYNDVVPGYLSSWLTHIAVDSQGNKWLVSHYDGLAKLEGTDLISYNTQESGLLNKTIYEITIDQQDVLWVASENGLSSFDGVTWSHFNTENSGIPENTVTNIYIDTQNNKWISTYPTGLTKYDDVSWVVINTTAEYFAIDSEGLLWVINSSEYWNPEGGVEIITRLASFDGTNWLFFSCPLPGVSNEYFKELVIDSQNNKWLFCFDGLLQFSNNNQWSLYNTSNSNLSDNLIYSLFIDSNDKIWIGTYRYGLDQFDSTNWNHYNTCNSGVPDFEINAIKFDSQNNIWFDTWGGGLTKFDGENFMTYNDENSCLPTNYIENLCIDSQNRKWFGSGYTLYCYSENSCTVFNPQNSILPGSIKCIFVDSNDIVWVGTNNGLLRINGNSWSVYTFSNSDLPDNNIYCISEDHLGKIWIGTWRGISVLNNGNWTTYENLPNHNVNCIYSDSFNNKWIGTDEGLACFDDQNWHFYNINNSDIPGNNVVYIASDSQNNLWLSIGGKGLVKYDGITWTCFNKYNSITMENFPMCFIIDQQDNKYIGYYTGFTFLPYDAVSNHNEYQKPNTFLIQSIYPNPFNPQTKIVYNVPSQAKVELKIYNVKGQLIKTLVDAHQNKGTQTIIWQGKNNDGYGVVSGIYFCRITVAGKQETQKILLLK